MVLFFQFDIPSSFGLPFVPGSHFSVFMCPFHNDAVEQIGPHLPDNFWDQMKSYPGVPGFYRAFLHPPAGAAQVATPEPHLQHQELTFSTQDEELVDERPALSVPQYPGVSASLDEISAVQEFKVGGQPAWLQEPEHPVCGCGAAMTFLCQVPADYEFPKLPTAPEQPDSPSSDGYVLFLANAIYFFACSRQCSPMAIYPVLQR